MIVLTKVTAETKDHHSITTKSIWTMNLTSHVIGKDSINMDDISVTSPTGFGRAAFEAQSVMARLSPPWWSCFSRLSLIQKDVAKM